MHPDGRSTRVDVLNMEKSRLGNGVLVWPGKMPLRIEPLPISVPFRPLSLLEFRGDLDRQETEF
jgi:hypothetical protein